MVSARRGEPCSDAVTSLWKDDLAERIDLAPLDAGGVGDVLEAVLGSPVDSGTHRRLLQKSGGNLLFLRELVRMGLSRGALVARGDVWMWHGPITEAPAVADLVRSRLAALAPNEREVVDVVALAEPIGLFLLDEICESAAARSCEAKRILVTQRSGRRLEARLEHPLYADVVSDAMSASTSTRLARDVAGTLLATGARRFGDGARGSASPRGDVFGRREPPPPARRGRWPCGGRPAGPAPMSIARTLYCTRRAPRGHRSALIRCARRAEDDAGHGT